MPVRVVSPEEVPVQQMPGRTLQWLATRETLGSEKLSIALMTCPVGSAARPVHGHRDVEEVVYVVEGEGEAWVDGETAPFGRGDVVLFPANALHMVRNTGASPLVMVCVFAPPTTTAAYILSDIEDPWADR